MRPFLAPAAILPLLAAGALAAPEAGPQGPPALSFAAGPVLGTLTRPAPGTAAPHPAAVVLHDLDGPDGRAKPYIRQLLGAELAVVEILSHPADGAAAEAARRALAGDPEVDAARIGVLAFGDAAAGALQGDFAARVLLYPGCAGLPGAAGPAPVLILFGTADPANPPAECLAAVARLRAGGTPAGLRGYLGAGHAWDLPGAPGRGFTLVPGPAGQPRIRVQPWPALTALAATEAAGRMARMLGGAPP